MTTRSLVSLRDDRPRALFGTTALAMARVSQIMATQTSIHMAGQSETLTLQNCPAALRPLFLLLTSRHSLFCTLTAPERTELRHQLLGGSQTGETTTRVLAAASQLNLATAQVMALPQHLRSIQNALDVFGY